MRQAECLAGLEWHPARPAADAGAVALLARRHGLSPAETEVLRALADGLSNAAIAKRLFIARATVKSHLRRISRKLNVRSRLEAAVLCAGEASL